MIAFRKATAADVQPALGLALRVFIEFEAPVYDEGAVDKFKSDCVENPTYIDNYLSGRHLMFVAVEGQEIVGMVNERGGGRISMLFVDGRHHRQGIATALMERMVCELKLRGIGKITLHSSPYAVAFYRHFGFSATGEQRKIELFTVTPMEYTPGEIWDVLDANANKTGRYVERGRKLAAGDHHLAVHVWKHNGKGEWLIDRRAPRGMSIDGKWETTGGSAIAGDDSLSAALRETKEELGIELQPDKGTLFQRIARRADDGHAYFVDVWIFECDVSLEAIRFQQSETCDAMWASADKIREMMAAGVFLSDGWYTYFDEMVERWG